MRWILGYSSGDVRILCIRQFITVYLFMAALWNRAGHYIFVLWFLLSFSLFFFPRLISAVADWMSAILLHMVWPCEFRTHVWNMLQTARWTYRTQKWRKKSPSAHHHTSLSGYIFAKKACINNRKKMLSSNISCTCPHNMANFSPLAAEIGSGHRCGSLNCGLPLMAFWQQKANAKC